MTTWVSSHRASGRLRRLGRGLGVSIAVIALAVAGAWTLWGRPAVVAKLESRLGRRITIDWLRPTWDGVAARGVTVFGRAPFEREVLARVDSLELRGARVLAGAAALAGATVIADGVDLQLLVTRGADNLRGDTRGAPLDRSGSSRTARAWGGDGLGPEIIVRRARLRGLVHLPNGQRVAFRSPRIGLDLRPGRPISANLDALTVDLQGALTLRVPRLALEVGHGRAEITLSGQNVSLAIPGAPAIAEGLSLDAAATGGGFSLALLRPPAAGGAATGSGSPFTVHARYGALGLSIEAHAERLPLEGLAPLAEPRGLGVETALADVDLSVGFDPLRMRLPWKLRLAASGLDVRHPAVDVAGWWNLPARAELSGKVELLTGRAVVDEGRLEVLGIPLAITGWSELGLFGRKPRGSVTVASPAAGIACGGLLRRQPPAIREALAGLELAGRLRFRVELGFDASDWDEMGLEVAVPSMCAVTAEPDVIENNRGALLEGKPGRLADRPELPLGPEHPGFTPLKRIPRHLVGAFLTAEDSAFFSHHGFEVEMIRRALAYNIERGQLAHGASTITQQLAKNLFLSHDRVLSRKIAETVLAWRLDELLPKNRALELYLNALELGPGVRGVAEAARTYFGKSLSELRPLESAHIASLPPNPVGFARRFRGGRVDDGWLHRLYDLLASMRRRGHISNAEVSAARAARLTLRKI